MTELYAAPLADDDRLDVVEALEAAGWIGDDEYPLSLLRKNGATFGVTGRGDSSLSGPGGWTTEFPSDMPTVVIVAACLAAADAARRTP